MLYKFGLKTNRSLSAATFLYSQWSQCKGVNHKIKNLSNILLTSLCNFWVTLVVLHSYLDCMSGLALLLFSLYFTALQQYSKHESVCFLCVPWPTQSILSVSGAQAVEELCAEICALPHTPHRRWTWTCWVPQHRYWQYAQKDPAREEEEKIRESFPLVTDNHLVTSGLITSLWPSQPVIEQLRLEKTSEIIESNL